MSQQSLFESVESPSPTLLPEGYPASPTASPESNRAMRMTVRSGERLFALLKTSSPVGLLSKMFLASSVWRSMAVSLTWKAKVTKRGRLYFQLAPSTRRTEGTGFGLLRTPTAVEAGARIETLETKDGTPAEVGKRAYRVRPDGSKVLQSVTLNQQVHFLLPTPNTRDHHSQGAGMNPKAHSVALSTMIEKLLPTPRTEGFDAGAHKGRADSLHSAAKMGLLPTPRQRDYKGTTQRGIHAPQDALPNAVAHLMATPQARDYRTGEAHRFENPDKSKNLNDQIGGKLSVDFVGWLMGYPKNWLD